MRRKGDAARAEDARARRGFFGKYAFAKAQGAAKMDYRFAECLDQFTFYAAGGRAYNDFDFGNFMWGQGMNRLGFNLGVAELGAEYNNFTQGRRQHHPFMDKGPGTDSGAGLLDAVEDQRAIVYGYNYPANPFMLQIPGEGPSRYR